MHKNIDKLLIAHRGESYLAPENTLAAISLAWQKGAKAVEIDVQLTTDNEIVVIHDYSTKILGDINRTVKKSTLCQLKEIDVGVFKGSEWKEERIPTLAEVLQTVPNTGKLIVEIKSDNKIVPVLAAQIKQSGLSNSQIEIISFNFNVISECKKQLPEYKMLWLLYLDYYLPAWLIIINKSKILKKITKSNLNGISVWAGKTINENFVTYFKSKNLLVYTWTVNNVSLASDLIEMGVDAITSDRASWLKGQLITNKE